MTLTGKVGLITGAGRGIGRELARTMAREGAALVVNDAGLAVDGTALGEHPAEALAAEIRASGGQAVPDSGSVVSWDAARTMVASALDSFGRLDFIVNNAGILRDAIFHKMSESEWDAVIAVHLKGTFNVTRAAAGHFRQQQSGAVLNMTSTSGLIGTYGQANYAAAKLGIVALTRAVALDMRRFNVRANAIAPFAWTRMTATIPGDGDAAARQRVDRLRALRPDHVAPLATYLVSEAAAGVTGQVFAVRGSDIVLFSLPRPAAAMHRPEGWTPASIGDRIATDLAPEFVPLETTSDVFPDDPRL